MADLGAIGSGIAGQSLAKSVRTAANPDPTYETVPGIRTKFATVAHEWQTTTTYPFVNDVPTTSSITGYVSLDNISLANQVVSLYHVGTKQWLKDTITDAGGYFSFDGLEPNPDVYFLVTKYGTTAKSLNINFTPPAHISIGLVTMAVRRPLVLINGQITEAPDGTTWAVGVPEALGTYSANVGDGTNTEYTITHNLGTRDVVVETRDNNSPYGVVDVDWEATTTNTVTVTFTTIPASNRYRINIIAL